jgi:DUF1680 family protein
MMKYPPLAALLRLVLFAACAASAPWCAAAPVQPQASAFPLDRVHLLPGPFKDRQDIDAHYLLDVVEPDRLLAGFRAQAGLPKKAERYGGWEARGINGHSLGHYLSALSALSASAGDEAVRRRAKERVDYIVSELAACQQANGDGYVLPVNKRVYDELRAGQIKASGFNLNGEWVPNYTLHKVLAGLRDASRFAGNKQALEVERRLADYLAGIYEKLTPAQAQEILKAEFGGMNEVFADLTVDTGDPKYLRLAETVFHHDAILGPLENGRDELNGKHANTQVPKLVGLARDYLLTGDPAGLRGVDTFWNTVVNERSFANGGHGDHEHFFPPAQFPEKLGPQNAETCNTYNMIKLAGLRFTWAPSAADMDFVERGLINHLLANIGREPGEFGYFLPFGGVAYKTFSSADDSWWCCVGSGMENPARYAEQAYFHHEATLWVNLYLASSLDWSERGFSLRQETAFPDSDSVRFAVAAKKPVRLALKFRHPYWCAAPEVKINGSAVAVDSKPSSYFTLEREWRDGDVVELRLPMAPRTEPLPHSDGKILALMYGPLQLVALVPADADKSDPARRRYGDHLKSSGRVDATPPVLVAADTASLLAAIKPDAAGGFSAFRATGVLQPDYPLVPFHHVYQEHYAAYFPLHTPEEWAAIEAEVRAAEAARAALEAATLDRVEPGFQQSEVEHKFASEKSETGDFRNRKWRDALPGGWFSYRMAVSPDKPVALVTEHWGADRGRTHELWIEGQRISATLRPGKREGFFEAAYAIPPELTRGKREVTVRFVASGGRSGTFGLRIVEAAAVTEAQWKEGIAP